MPYDSNATPQLQTSETPLNSSSASGNIVTQNNGIVNNETSNKAENPFANKTKSAEDAENKLIGNSEQFKIKSNKVIEDAVNEVIDDTDTSKKIVEAFSRDMDNVDAFVQSLGVDRGKLSELLNADFSSPGSSLNAFGRFDAMSSTVDIDKAVEYYSQDGEPVTKKVAKQKADNALRKFI